MIGHILLDPLKMEGAYLSERQITDYPGKVEAIKPLLIYVGFIFLITLALRQVGFRHKTAKGDVFPFDAFLFRLLYLLFGLSLFPFLCKT